MVIVKAEEKLINALLHLRLQFHGEALPLLYSCGQTLCFILS